MISSAFILGSIVASILLIWFRTEAYVEYCRLFRLNKISKYKDFDEKHKNDVSLSYIGYLRQYHNGFTIRMITCPICLAVWLSVTVALSFAVINLAPIVFISGLIIFGTIDRLLG